MSTSKSILIVCSLVFLSSGIAHADCDGKQIKEIDGKKYTCCKKKSETNPGCDAQKLKVGDKLQCGQITKVTWDCTEGTSDKPADKKADNKDKKK